MLCLLYLQAFKIDLFAIFTVASLQFLGCITLQCAVSHASVIWLWLSHTPYQCSIKGPYPLGDRRYNRRYNRLTTADCTADCTTDCLVGMAYLLGNWATGRRATAVAGRWETADLYQACLIFHRRLVARRRSSPGNQSATSRRWCQSSSGYGP